MYPESLLNNKLKWFLIQFIKKYQTQYRYLGKYLLGQSDLKKTKTKHTDPSKCINDHTLRSDTSFVGLEESVTLKIVRQNPPRSEWEWESPLSDSQ